MKSKRPMVRPNLGFWRQLIAYEQNVKENAGSVRLVRDEAQPECLLPDVYLSIAIQPRPVLTHRPNIFKRHVADAFTRLVIAEPSADRGFVVLSPSPDQESVERQSDEPRERRMSGLRPKFQPVLEPLLEITEAVC
ncbi:hypothetical protein ANCDUO_10209 [Ancylostoma duodenale]|uniref:Uncharacterized protein n=1 Tax=Ancylostoma duodenale TaxID=51022 RepID=A0A0C2DAY8_9BILA|nr:hypothetical protein ANCDUO_10209 [Ancylostoma duodenale]